MVGRRLGGMVLSVAAFGAAFSVAFGAQSSGWQASDDAMARAAKSIPGFNYDEAGVGSYTLPDPLNLNGVAVRSLAEWPSRRADVLELFREHVYGRRPGAPDLLRFEVVEQRNYAMDGTATFKRIAVISVHQQREHRFDIALYLPNARPGAVPTFLFINNRAGGDPKSVLGVASPFWPAGDLIARGYGIASIQNDQLAPDNAQRFREGVIRLFEGDAADRPANAWGALAAWGWGASRALDYFQTDPRVDATRVAVVGHSRGGKAALWAGAEDERFALVVSNESGEGGAALARRNFGETVARINNSFPHWFSDNYKRFNDRPQDLPVDQHMLLGLMAPRALYVASASDDLWADPRGEFLSLAHASPVYALFDAAPIDEDDMPAVDVPLIVGQRGYHVRTGRHDLTPWDWARFADLADRIGWK